jgi:hypothetical protein
MAYDWKSTDLPWNNTSLVWKDTNMPWNNIALPWQIPPTQIAGFFMLLETGTDYLLLEDGSKLILE